MGIEFLRHLDNNLVIALHGGNNLFLDKFAIIFTTSYIWIPLYLSLLLLIIKNNESWRKISLILGIFAVTIILSNIINNVIVKPSFERLRPFNDPHLHSLLPLINGYTAKGFSFYSSHTSNSFFIFTFLTLLIRNKTLSFSLLLWAITIAWTRLYLGVYYPTDIIMGVFLGISLAILGYFSFYKIYKITNEHLHFISAKYTETGYSLSDIDTVLNILMLTLIYTMFHAIL